MILRLGDLATIALVLLASSLLVVEAQPIGDALYRSWSSAIPPELFSQIEASTRLIHSWEQAHSPSLKDGKRVTRWFPVGQEPKFALEEAILHLAKLADAGPTLVGYEWWIQKISEQGPLNFHVDKDEAVATLEHYLLHPLWSSVFYVTDEGGGTLITNQLSPRGNGYHPLHPEEAAWSFPQANKFLRFNGTLLHGVVPGRQKGKFAKERITFLVNFWHVVPKLPNCAELPHDKVDGLKLWTKAELQQLRDSYTTDVKPQPQPLRVVDARPAARESGATPTYRFQMELPGQQSQTVLLPKLEPKGGETYYIHWRSSKNVVARAKKLEKKMLASAEEAAAKVTQSAGEDGKADESGEQQEQSRKKKKKSKRVAEDEEEERPARRRKRRAPAAADEDDDREAAPRRRKKRSAAEDEDQDAEAPPRRKKRKASARRLMQLDDDDSLDEPRKAKQRGGGKRRPSRSDDDEDDRPRRRRPQQRRRRTDDDDEPRRRARPASPRDYERAYAEAQKTKKEIKERWRIQ